MESVATAITLTSSASVFNCLLRCFHHVPLWHVSTFVASHFCAFRVFGSFRSLFVYICVHDVQRASTCSLFALTLLNVFTHCFGAWICMLLPVVACVLFGFCLFCICMFLPVDPCALFGFCLCLDVLSVCAACGSLSATVPVVYLNSARGQHSACAFQSKHSSRRSSTFIFLLSLEGSSAFPSP